MQISVNGARLFFDVVGPLLEPSGDIMAKRPTMLMLHGGPGYDHSTLRPHFDQFSDQVQIIYLDHRGGGRSSGTIETWTLDQWADDVAEFCRVLGIEKPIVFGQSFGGMVAMHYAARHIDGPSKLILSSTTAKFRLDETVKMTRMLGGERPATIAREFFSAPTLDRYEAYADACVPLYLQTEAPDAGDYRKRAIHKPEIAVHFFEREMRDMDLLAEIAAVTCPTLVLAGAQDPVTPVICSKDIANAIGTNAQLEIFEGCGHGVHRDNAEGSARVMRAFLDA